MMIWTTDWTQQANSQHASNISIVEQQSIVASLLWQY